MPSAARRVSSEGVGVGGARWPAALASEPFAGQSLQAQGEGEGEGAPLVRSEAAELITRLDSNERLHWR